MVVILAAGRGSRSEIPEGTSKCAVPLDGNEGYCSVSRLISQMYDLSEERNFAVIVGYGSTGLQEKVLKDIKNIQDSVTVTFISNPYWKERGTGYSLSLCSELIPDKSGESLYIFEGDSVYSTDCLETLFNSKYSSSVLVRDPIWFSQSSVVVIANDKREFVSCFIYDSSHRTHWNDIYSATNIAAYESMQCWKVNSCGMKKILSSYRKSYQEGSEPRDQTNLGPLNTYLAEYRMRATQYNPRFGHDYWVNLNTPSDFKRAQDLIRSEDSII